MATSVETKKALSAALKHLCSKKPYNEISISEITDLCNLNRQSFYYHFNDKNSLLYWTYENSDFGILLNTLNENYKNQMIYFLRAMQSEKDFFTNTLRNNLMIFEKFIFQKINSVFIRQINSLDVKSSLTAEQRAFLSGYYSFGLCGIITKWAADGMAEKPEKVDEYIRCLDLQAVFEVYFKNKNN